jgi:hypothetical protein
MSRDRDAELRNSELSCFGGIRYHDFSHGRKCYLQIRRQGKVVNKMASEEELPSLVKEAVQDRGWVWAEDLDLRV